VKIWAYMMVKHLHKNYAGATAGSLLVDGTNRYESEPLHVHVGDNSLDTLRIPENIANFIGASSAYMDKDGLLVPQMVLNSLATLTTSLTYTGTNVFTIPGSNLTQRGIALFSTLAVKIKPLEQLMAPFINERFQMQYGPSYLDTTFLYDSSSLVCLGMISRRAMSPLMISRAKSFFSGISYTSTGVSVSGTGTGRSFYSHVFRQANRRDFSGYDNVSQLNVIGVHDGIVQGALTSNMSGNDGPDLPANERSMVQMPPGHGPKFYHGDDEDSYIGNMQSFVTRHAGLTYGNYGGRGYSAGMHGGAPEIVNGKYVVAPIDAEDAAYKAHDEAYISRNPAVRAAADARLVKELSALPRLSNMGKAAKYYFDASLWHSPSSRAE